MAYMQRTVKSLLWKDLPRSRKSKMRIDAKSMVLGVLVGLLIEAVIYIAFSYSSVSNSSYSMVRVVLGQTVSVQLANNTYRFKMNAFDTIINGSRVMVSSVYSGDQRKEFLQLEGEVCKVFGIEIIVKEVKSDYLTLWVKPL